MCENCLTLPIKCAEFPSIISRAKSSVTRCIRTVLDTFAYLCTTCDDSRFNMIKWVFTQTVLIAVQVSDQLVEINGDSTAGMTHSQAVEQIRRGGHRIHLVLKRGNGYVPDYGENQ